MTTQDSMLRIERMNYMLGAVATLVAVFIGDRSEILGVAIGVALTCLNFTFLRRLVFRWTADTAAGRTSNRVVLILPKMVGLLAAVVLVLTLLPVSTIAFTIGYSVFIASIAVETVLSLLRGPASPADCDTDSHPNSPGPPGSNDG